MSFIQFGPGMRMLFDGQQNFTRTAVPVYLRIKNFTEVPGLQADGTYNDFIELGVPFAPTGAAVASTGFTDIPIVPPPGVIPISTRDLGIFAGRLNFGSKYFDISHTFVQAQMTLLGLVAGQEVEVFRDRDGKKCIGLYYDGNIYNIFSMQPRVAAGEFVNWRIIGNAFTEVADTPL